MAFQLTFTLGPVTLKLGPVTFTMGPVTLKLVSVTWLPQNNAKTATSTQSALTVLLSCRWIYQTVFAR